MRLTPTEEQAELKAAVRRFCEEQVTPERLAVWERLPRGIDDATWQAIATLGWFGFGIPANAGGSGQGLVELACLLEECSRGLIPRSVINAIGAAHALATLDPSSPELAALASGAQTVTLAFDEEAARTPAHFSTTVVPKAGGSIVSGEKWFVADAEHANNHIIAARDGDSLSLCVVGRDGLRIAPLRTFDGDRQAVVRYDAPVHRVIGDDAAFLRVQRERRALALAELLGTMSAALDMAVAYVKEREQFGQKIGVFQAVQHQVADMGMLYTAARDLGWQAITRMAYGTEEGTELDIAAAFIGQASKRLTLTAHHLHGGAGYVIEHPLHCHAERAQALCIRYAAEGAALAQIAADLLDR